jgi:cysteinyl-tRNA synthetase
MRLYNTLSGKTEDLELSSGRLGIYVCGVTPYDVAHVGHAMSLMVYDVFVRYLRWPGNPHGGVDVTYVSNYTDVDDKLIERGAELNRDPIELAAENIVAWEEEQELLGLTPPDVRPRVTGEIPGIIETIERIDANEHGYASDAGDVYFRVRSKEDYGKLSHRDIEDLRSGTRFEPGEGKEFPLDFALWKAAKAGEPQWDSPWGPGRPGWHIECTTMSQRYLGTTFDIHGGGLDLIFPHHENEIAQGEAASHESFARLWMHNGMIQRDGEKMSKSIGNVVTVEDALSRWSPDAIRLYVLGSHYRSPNNLTDEAMAAASRGVERLRAALQQGPGSATAELDSGSYRERFVQGMEDDLGTPQAMAALFDLARAINRDAGEGRGVSGAQEALQEMAGVLGLKLQQEDRSLSPELTAAIVALAEEQGVPLPDDADGDHAIDLLLGQREIARTQRNWAAADGIRDGLSAAGIQIEDTADGPRWSTGG